MGFSCSRSLISSPILTIGSPRSRLSSTSSASVRSRRVTTRGKLAGRRSRPPRRFSVAGSWVETAGSGGAADSSSRPESGGIVDRMYSASLNNSACIRSSAVHFSLDRPNRRANSMRRRSSTSASFCKAIRSSCDILSMASAFSIWCWDSLLCVDSSVVS